MTEPNTRHEAGGVRQKALRGLGWGFVVAAAVGVVYLGLAGPMTQTTRDGLAFPLFILGSIATAVELLRSPPSRWGIASAVFGVSGALIVGPDATQNAIEGSDVMRFVGVLGFVMLLVVVVGLGLMRALGAQR